MALYPDKTRPASLSNITWAATKGRPEKINPRTGLNPDYYDTGAILNHAGELRIKPTASSSLYEFMTTRRVKMEMGWPERTSGTEQCTGIAELGIPQA